VFARGRPQVSPTGLSADFPLKRVAILDSLVQRELPHKRVRDCRRFTILRLSRHAYGEPSSAPPFTQGRRFVSANNTVIPPYGLCGFPLNKERMHDMVMPLAENFHFDKSASIAFDWSNANMG